MEAFSSSDSDISLDDDDEIFNDIRKDTKSQSAYGASVLTRAKMSVFQSIAQKSSATMISKVSKISRVEVKLLEKKD